MAGNPSRDLLTRTTAKTATADRAEETQYLGSTAGKALQQGIVECLGRDRARKTSRPSTAAGEVSRCNGFPCHWVMVSSAERVGLPPCNGSSTLIKLTHRCLCNSASDTQHIKSCGDGGVAKVTGGGNHWESLVTNLHVGGLGTSGRCFFEPRAAKNFGSIPGD